MKKKILYLFMNLKLLNYSILFNECGHWAMVRKMHINTVLKIKHKNLQYSIRGDLMRCKI